MCNFDNKDSQQTVDSYAENAQILINNTERTPEVRKFIDDHQELFWFTPDPKSEKVSDELLVEIVLNYGSMNEAKELFKAMDISNVANIFFKTINKSERGKGNYNEVILNYFTLYFNRYASRSFI